MYSYTKIDKISKKSRGFTLFELIVVVLIVSLIGFLVFSEAIKAEKKVDALDPTTIASTLRQSFKEDGEVELFCVNNSTECYILNNGAVSPYDGAVRFGTDVEIYLLDEDDNFVHIDEFGRYKDNKITLRFHLYENGSTTQMVIQNSKGIYYLPSYFGKSKEVNDTDEAKELWIKDKYDLGDSGSYY